MGGIMLAWQGSFNSLITNLEGIGFFEYVLPFLLIFALVYGILSSIKMFKENRGVTAIIAFSIGLLALWQGIAVAFFAQIFPRLGIGLSILIAALILVGVFVPMDKYGKEGWGNYIFLGLGGLIFIVTLIKSGEAYAWYSGAGWFTENLAVIVVGLVIIGAIVAVIFSHKREKS